MNPINWKSISAPSIDINSKPANKVDEKNKGFNTYRSNQKVDSNPSTSKLNNQPALIKQASSHVTQNSGGTVKHIKNSTPPIKSDRKILDILETLESCVYRHNATSSAREIFFPGFKILARNILNKSTAPQSKLALENFKSDLKDIKKYLDPKIYSQIKNSLDNQLKIALEHKFRVWKLY